MQSKKVLFLIAALLMVAGFAFSTPAAEERATAAEGPQYGGTLTFSFWQWYDPKNWDVTSGSWTSTSKFLYPLYSFLVVGDTETYGPRGTNQYHFQLHQEIPEAYLGGDLAESWEVSEKGVVFKLRKGVMYTGNDRIGMKAREVTAEDIVAGMNHVLAGPLGTGIKAFVKDIRATDKYTVVVDFNYYHYLWGPDLVYGMGVVYYPPEVIKAGASEWRNQSGSGPFILDSFVSGSGATYKKNPNYYGTTNIGGTEYKIPFVDTLVLPIIPDELTMVGALRTGKIDVCQVPVRYVDSLADTNPQLIVSEYTEGGMMVAALDCVDPPFNNREVRRALHIGIDRQAYIDTVLLGKGQANPFPYPGTPYHSTLAEMPESTRILYEYNPDLAKKILAEQGYPNGFKTQMYFKPGVARDSDAAAYLESQLRKIGVQLEMIGMEQTVHEALRFNREFDGIYLRSDASGAETELPQRMTDCASMAASYNNAYFDEQLMKAQRMSDVTARTKLLKEMAIYFLDDGSNINLPSGKSFKYWWPWVINYYGEEEMGYGNHQPALNTIWIDQDVKRSLGFR